MIFDLSRAILIAAAVVPAFLLLRYIYKKDKREKEPAGLLISLVILGAVSTSLALVSEKIGMRRLESFSGSELEYLIRENFVVVACSEEFFKYLLLRLRTWRHPAFNWTFDGLVYAIYVSLGFALWENIGYVMMYGLSVALTRAVTAVPGHACFGVFMGAFYGLAKRADVNGHPLLSFILRLLSLATPIFLHGYYDFAASVSGTGYAVSFLGFIAVLFFASWLVVRRMSNRDKPMHSYNTTRY